MAFPRTSECIQSDTGAVMHESIHWAEWDSVNAVLYEHFNAWNDVPNLPILYRTQFR